MEELIFRCSRRTSRPSSCPGPSHVNFRGRALLRSASLRTSNTATRWPLPRAGCSRSGIYAGIEERPSPSRGREDSRSEATPEHNVLYSNEVNFYGRIRPELDIETPISLGGNFDKKTLSFGQILDDLRLRGAQMMNVLAPIRWSRCAPSSIHRPRCTAHFGKALDSSAT